MFTQKIKSLVKMLAEQNICFDLALPDGIRVVQCGKDMFQIINGMNNQVETHSIHKCL